jgi:hypothetical protein
LDDCLPRFDDKRAPKSMSTKPYGADQGLTVPMRYQQDSLETIENIAYQKVIRSRLYGSDREPIVQKI